jgi:3-deoxy-D-manno-octulosonic-acid transferase
LKYFRRNPIPNSQGKEVIWIHAVSVGETKSVKSLFHELKKLYPKAFFLVTTTTLTGQEEAKRSLKEADAFRFLPLDIGFNVRRWAKKLRPKLFILVESDFWPSLLRHLKRVGCTNILVSGKLSEKSAKRFKIFSYFSRKLFSLFDLLLVQNEEHRQRFLPLVPDPSRIEVTGNLKLDATPLDVQRLTLLDVPEPSITISCTHAPEEEWLLDLLPKHLFIFLAPRHPERFDEVAKLLDRKGISYFRWSRFNERRGGERVLLVDAMGQLPICYRSSRLCVVGGSFIDSVGGHNVFEPCLYGIPAFFGPHTYSQNELVSRVLSAGAGAQTTLEELPRAIQSFFDEPAPMRARVLAARSGGITEAAVARIKKHLGFNHLAC